jgi:hypothetical protein
VEVIKLIQIVPKCPALEENKKLINIAMAEVNGTKPERRSRLKIIHNTGDINAA